MSHEQLHKLGHRRSRVNFFRLLLLSSLADSLFPQFLSFGSEFLPCSHLLSLSSAKFPPINPSFFPCSHLLSLSSAMFPPIPDLTQIVDGAFVVQSGAFVAMASRAAHSSYRDRTKEFRSAVESARKQLNVGASSSGGIGSGAGSRLEGSKAVASIQSEFNRRASKIGLGIHQTSEKLTRLAKLTKRTSVFDDPTKDIRDLTAIIKKDIGALSAAVADLQHLCDSQNETGNISRDTTSHSTTVIDNLKNRLMSTTNELKDVLIMRTENMKVHEDRRKLFSAAAGKETANPFIRQRPLVNRGNSSDSAAPPAPWATESSESAPLFPRSTLTNRFIHDFDIHLIRFNILVRY